jgi:hypothetical protein
MQTNDIHFIHAQLFWKQKIIKKESITKIFWNLQAWYYCMTATDFIAKSVFFLDNTPYFYIASILSFVLLPYHHFLKFKLKLEDNAMNHFKPASMKGRRKEKYRQCIAVPIT